MRPSSHFRLRILAPDISIVPRALLLAYWPVSGPGISPFLATSVAPALPPPPLFLRLPRL